MLAPLILSEAAIERAIRQIATVDHTSQVVRKCGNREYKSLVKWFRSLLDGGGPPYRHTRLALAAIAYPNLEVGHPSTTMLAMCPATLNLDC
jgi:hypothetical protein